MSQLGSAEYANDFIRSRGGMPRATSGDYWAQKWNEFGKNDPAYYQKRLAQADELTGGPKGNPAAAAMMMMGPPVDASQSSLLWKQMLQQANGEQNMAGLALGGGY